MIAIYCTTAFFRDHNRRSKVQLYKVQLYKLHVYNNNLTFCNCMHVHVLYIVALTEPVIQQLAESEHRRVCGEQEGTESRYH